MSYPNIRFDVFRNFLTFDIHATNLMLKTIFILYAIVFLFLTIFQRYFASLVKILCYLLYFTVC